MKRSNLRRIIREEITKVRNLNEAGSMREKILSPKQAMKIVNSKGGLPAYDNGFHSPSAREDYRRGKLYITGIAPVNDTKALMRVLSQGYNKKYINDVLDKHLDNVAAVNEILDYVPNGTGDDCPRIYVVAYDEPLEDAKMFGYYCSKGIYSTNKLVLGF